MRGSSTVGLGVMPYLIQGFANARGFRVKRYDNDKHDIRVYQLQQSTQGSSCFQITVHASGSNDAGPALIDKTAQIGMSSRTYSDEEIKEIADSAGRRGAPRGEIERVVALDGVAIVVNRDNPVQSLSLCQIANIFSGKITDWRELRGDPGPIHLQIRRGASGTFETFQDLVLKKCKVELADGGARHQTYGRVLEEVENDRRSIGFAPFSLLTDKVRILDINGNCSVVQSLSKPSIKTEDYLLARRLFIFTPFRLGTHTRDFITFVSGDDRADAALTLQVPPSGDRQDLDIQRGAVDQRIEYFADRSKDVSTRETSMDAGSSRDFRRHTENGQRMGITYRFRFGSEELDTKARQDLQRLVRYLQLNPTRKTLFLAGFTDDVGNQPINIAKARARAKAVQQELIALGAANYVASIRTEGFGKVLPVACNDRIGRKDNDPGIGESKNRRVEVWLVPRLD